MHMAITLREFKLMAFRRRPGWISIGLIVASGLTNPEQSVRAQTQTNGSPTTVVSPTLNAQVTYSDNATQTSKDKRQSDTIVSLSPGVSVQYRTAHSAVTGNMQLSAVNYLHNSQADRLLPNGRLALHTDFARQGVGLDASLSAEQVQSQFTSVTAASTGTADTYTNTRLSMSPFLEHRLDDNTLLHGRLERSQTHTTANNDSLTQRPETSSNAAGIGVTRRPTRLGYEFNASYHESLANGQSQALNSQRLVKGTLLYALTPDLELGWELGRESTQVLQESFRDTVKGVQIDWHPSSRTQLKALVEDRFFGRAWTADFSQRMATFSFGLNSSRQIDTNLGLGKNSAVAGGSTQALLDAMLTSQIPNAAERTKAVNDMITQRNLPQQLGSTRDLYDLNTLVRQNTALRVGIMGVRSLLMLSAGEARTQPLSGDAFSSLLGAGNNTRDRYIDAQINHKLTPVSTLTMGLRMARARVINTLQGTTTSSRETGLRLSVATALSPRTQLVWGMRRQRTVGSTVVPNEVTENTVFSGLEHRF
jgi:uncharacterized protein (PEP-CTERM system associated)